VSPAVNHLIERLPAPERLRLLAACEQVPLQPGEVLWQCGQRTRHVLFPVDGFVSLVRQTEHHPSFDIGMVGREGMLGLHVALGVAEAPAQARVQTAGRAWRLRGSLFRRALVRSPALQDSLGRYLHVCLVQLAISAGCLHVHLLRPRLARWLLMGQDRIGSDQLHITHEMLAGLLGVHRVAITLAAGALQRAGLIRYHRGELTVLDRHGLEAAACSCYHADRQVYADWLA
jgi:CRP-like cAMP-binding protein